MAVCQPDIYAAPQLLEQDEEDRIMAIAANLDFMDGGTAAQLRGDPITGDRYYSKEFMEKGLKHL